jgi:hypothetical protein
MLHPMVLHKRTLMEGSKTTLIRGHRPLVLATINLVSLDVRGALLLPIVPDGVLGGFLAYPVLQDF